MAAFPSKPIALISSASTVNYAASFCVMISMFMGSFFRMVRKPDVTLQVYTKAGDAASGS